MKKAIFFLVLAVIATFPSYAVSMAGQEFKFPNGAKEWSLPIETTIGSKWMEKRNQPFVKISVRVRAIRKILKGCRYEVEITNVDQNGIRFEIDNGNGKAKVKLKPNAVTVLTMDSFTNEKRESVEACADCMMNLTFHEIEGYKK